MLQIIDISSSILYDRSKAENKFLSIINASVSHEMRNPLNSILAENILKEELIKRLKELLN
jgi:signal transduction histidine kinase